MKFKVGDFVIPNYNDPCFKDICKSSEYNIGDKFEVLFITASGDTITTLNIRNGNKIPPYFMTRFLPYKSVTKRNHQPEWMR